MNSAQKSASQREPEATSRRKAFVLCFFAYAVALLAAVVVVNALPHWHPLAVAALADLVATAVVFGFSVYCNNSSIYDPYWSVAPPLIAVYFVTSTHTDGQALSTRMLIVMLLMCLWSVRLTFNWARQWRGLAHEDWRYVDIRARSGRSYWAVSFIGIHLMPTLAVFLGCLSLYGVAVSDTPLGWLDLFAALVTFAAISVETIADQQLHGFVATNPPSEAILDRGLWSVVRHPNYSGEILFWCGLCLFSIAANRSALWVLLGPTTMLALFVFVSVPMIDARMSRRRPDYAAHMQRVPALLPGLIRRR